ncbi:hypothetical protein NW768_011869 [Fusarium equiseti]|uniref:Uncharacterized protein n=1 Tax=Fusarium equiseti TaxID=61235 RepID=A0ABQ8QX42_FUSEQ|nr:hypothetical protein NW768_011869 [Fusarium equiseti]
MAPSTATPSSLHRAPVNHPRSRRLRIQEQQNQEEQQHEQPAPAPDHASISSAPPSPHVNHHAPRELITPDIRAKIVATLATLKRKSGAPFSFLTSGDKPSGADESTHQQPLPPDHLQSSAPSLKLSWLLSPLQASGSTHAQENIHQSARA